jgi:hypothetical protein
MAKKKTAGRSSKLGGEGKPVRIAADIATMARSFASYNGLAIGDYVSDLLRAAVTRDYGRMMHELAEKGGGK